MQKQKQLLITIIFTLILSLIAAVTIMAAPESLHLSIVTDATQVKTGDVLTLTYQLVNSEIVTRDVIFYAEIPTGTQFRTVENADPITYTTGLLREDGSMLPPDVEAITWHGAFTGPLIITLTVDILDQSGSILAKAALVDNVTHVTEMVVSKDIFRVYQVTYMPMVFKNYTNGGTLVTPTPDPTPEPTPISALPVVVNLSRSINSGIRGGFQSDCTAVDTSDLFLVTTYTPGVGVIRKTYDTPIPGITTNYWSPVSGIEFQTQFSGTLTATHASLVVSGLDSWYFDAVQENPVEIYVGTWADDFLIDTYEDIYGRTVEFLENKSDFITLANVNGAGGGVCVPLSSYASKCTYDIPVSALNTTGITKFLFRFRTIDPCQVEDIGYVYGSSDISLHIE